jgi:hypothetical protein
MAEQRSPKPQVAGSSPVSPAYTESDHRRVSVVIFRQEAFNVCSFFRVAL